ncbi:F-box protein At2g40925-like [Lycium ferocissimum]|uniref:F-box protein At2g40925-like n=1 Tax=Lycium ferocissimum TaxID=112874 RepID=UPI0028154FE6|nr:F-box protein At2g40925-like [Lycium ferocissimum]
MKRRRKLSDKLCAVEISEDIIINILHHLPSKSLAKFKCVSKRWLKYISDSSLSYSCRSKLWRPQPYLVGFFYQARDTCEPSKIQFFFSSEESSLAIDDCLDQSVTFLGRTAYIVASSNGFLLCNKQRVYYVYNPATRQSVALPKTQSKMNDPTVGFICKVDDPDKDVISFTVIRYWFSLSNVTIESFTSETNVWTVSIILAVPLRPYFSNYMKSASAGVIDGVFCWLDQGPQITVYDSVNKSFWALEFPGEMVPAIANYFLGFSGGDFYFASYVKTAITVWQLKSNIRSRNALWVKQYETNVATTVPFGLTGSLHIEVQNMDIHPTIPSIFYLDVRGKVISYDMETDIPELVHDFGEYWWRTKHFKLFSYEWHQWPRLL